MTDRLVTLIMPATHISAGLTILWLAHVSANRKLKKNFFVGIRTQFTLKSAETWRVGHSAASRYIAIGGCGLFGSASLGLIFHRDFQWATSLGGAAWVVVWMIIASTKADDAVRAYLNETTE